MYIDCTIKNCGQHKNGIYSCIAMTSACFEDVLNKIGETQKLMVPTEISDWQVISTHFYHTQMCCSSAKVPFVAGPVRIYSPCLQCQGQPNCK